MAITILSSAVSSISRNWLAPLAMAAFLPMFAQAAELKPQVSEFWLENGMQVVVIPDRRAPVVTHMVWYRAGSADEETGKSGIAHFLEHLLFKRTKNTPDGEFSRKIAEIGGEENAFTTVDYTAYYQKVTPQALPTMMSLEADRMVNLDLVEGDITTERQVILEERRQRIDNEPGGILSEAMNAALYRNHPYGRPIIGWQHEMEQLSLADAVEFYKRYYRPSNAILVVAGDVEPDAVLEMAKKTYGAITDNGRVDDVRKRPSEPQFVVPASVTYSDPRVAQASVRYNYVTAAYRTAEPGEAEALDLLAAILGGSQTSRIKAQLTVDEQVATSAGAFFQGGYYDTGEFNLYIAPAPGVQMEEAERRLMAIIEDVKQNGVTQEEVDRARNQLIISTVFEQDSQVTMARLFGVVLATGNGVDDVLEWPDRLRKVTPEQIKAVANRYLDARRSVTGYLLPAKKEG